MSDTFTCCECREIKPVASNSIGGTGYGTTNGGLRICYACCAERDRCEMIATGRATLYLSVDHESLAANGTTLEYITRVRPLHPRNWGWKVTNWPGTLRMDRVIVHKGKHNIARVRYDVWFIGPDGAKWYGVQIGDNTQIVRCRRLKSRS